MVLFIWVFVMTPAMTIRASFMLNYVAMMDSVIQIFIAFNYVSNDEPVGFRIDHINNFKRFITLSEIDSVIQSLPTKKAQHQTEFERKANTNTAQIILQNKNRRSIVNFIL